MELYCNSNKLIKLDIISSKLEILHSYGNIIDNYYNIYKENVKKYIL